MIPNTQTSHHYFTECHNKYYTINTAVRFKSPVSVSKSSVSEDLQNGRGIGWENTFSLTNTLKNHLRAEQLPQNIF